MFRETIGIVGGFGGFATLHFYKRLLESFNTGYERDYPRIIMDNDFTMPSRTRALLYDEEVELITQMIARAVQNLLNLGADYIVLVCGTAHWFLDGVYKLVPEAKDKILNAIDLTGIELERNGVRECFVIAAEGTLKTGLYGKYFEKYGIKVDSPAEADYEKVRYYIESVKKNIVTTDTKEGFLSFVLANSKKQAGEDSVPQVILGCTELCLLTDIESEERVLYYDPMEIVIQYLKNHLK